MSELAFLSAVEQAELVRTREASPVELVETYLTRVEKIDPSLNAMVTCTGDEALDGAREAQESDRRGRFHGVPIAIKDLTETAGIPTTYSSKAFADYVPTEDAAVVRRLKGAGFVVLGKTNTCEFGTLPVTESDLNGDCHNPWKTELTPGGSSGGAAAGVAGGLAPVAQGSDSGGSLRIPASCCGLFALKPARGRVSEGPQRGEFWAGFSTSGVIARHVRDAAAVMDAIAGYESGDPYWLPPPERPFEEEVAREPGCLRIAFTTNAPNGATVEPEVAGAVHDAARLLESLGHEVEEATPDWFDPDAAVDYFRVALQSSTAYLRVRDLSLIEPLNRMLAELGEQTSSLDYIRSLERLRGLARRVVRLWDFYEVLLTPTLALPPVPVGWIFEPDDHWEQLRRSAAFTPFTPVANITGQPAASVPLSWSDDGIPIGVMLTGRPADEATLLRLGAQLEQARPWSHHRPPLS